MTAADEASIDTGTPRSCAHRMRVRVVVANGSPTSEYSGRCSTDRPSSHAGSGSASNVHAPRSVSIVRSPARSTSTTIVPVGHRAA